MKLFFAERLRDLRVERGLNQSALAEALGTTQRRISYWETGKVEPDLLSLCKLAEFFSVSLEYLVGMQDY